ncbi:MAG: pseudouridine synthase [Bacteriovoracaceae bacterium]
MSGDQNKTAGICFLREFSSLFEALEEATPVTKSQLKKLGENKKDWEKSIAPKEERLVSLDALNYLKINPLCSNQRMRVLEEDDDFIVLSKGYNCHSHPLKYSDTNNALSYIRQNFSDKILTVNSSRFERGLLYRLDYETSGLLIYCKKNFLHKELRENFATLVKEKTYYAIVQGNFSSQLLEHKLVYGGPKNSKAKAFGLEYSEGITASIEARRVEHNKERDLTMVQIALEEGHRHQIRAQLAAEGFPILGDELYGGERAARLFLHCYSYSVNGRSAVDESLDLFSSFFNFNG